MPRVGWLEYMCMCVCPSRVSTSPHVEVAKNPPAGFIPCPCASVIRTTVCPSLSGMVLLVPVFPACLLVVSCHTISYTATLAIVDATIMDNDTHRGSQSIHPTNRSSIFRHPDHRKTDLGSTCLEDAP